MRKAFTSQSKQYYLNLELLRWKDDSRRHRSSETFVVTYSQYCNTGSADSGILTGNQSRQDLRRWLSPSDPSTNHNIACSAHHEGTATWFFQGNIFKEWKSSGSLLWVHGKRISSTAFDLQHLIEFCICSWIREEYSLVCQSLDVSVGVANISSQFHDHPGH